MTNFLTSLITLSALYQENTYEAPYLYIFYISLHAVIHQYMLHSDITSTVNSVRLCFPSAQKTQFQIHSKHHTE